MRQHGRELGVFGALRQQQPFIVVVGLFVVSALAVGVILGRPDLFQVHFYSPRLLAGVILYMPLLALYHATRSVWGAALVRRRWIVDRPAGWRRQRAGVRQAPVIGLVAGALVLPVQPQEQETATRGNLPTIARVHYEGGGDWYANPSSLPNLLHEIAQRSTIRVAGRPVEVQLTDPDLPDYPYLYLTGHGNVSLSDREVEALRRHLRGGGFLHADDNYGLDSSFRREVARVFPDEVLTDVPLDHPVYRIRYAFPGGLPKIHEHDGLPAQGLGIFLEGRLAVFYSYQSDLGDGWEDATVHRDPPELREQAIRMGINLFLYALSAGPPR